MAWSAAPGAVATSGVAVLIAATDESISRIIAYRLTGTLGSVDISTQPD